MLRLWGHATNLCQQLSAVVNTFRAALVRALNDLDSISLPAVPNGGRYDHPVAGVAA